MKKKEQRIEISRKKERSRKISLRFSIIEDGTDPLVWDLSTVCIIVKGKTIGERQ